MKRDGVLHRGMALYYAGVQAAHLVALVWEGLNYLQRSELILLAPPPAGGWTPRQESILLLLGALDALIILSSIPFLVRTMTRKPGRFHLGAVVLGAFSLTALVFGVVTWPTGVWTTHPVYLLEGALYIPIGVLLVLHLRWLLEGGAERGRSTGRVSGTK